MSVMKDNDIKIILADLYSDCFEVSDTVDVNSLPRQAVTAGISEFRA